MPVDRPPLRALAFAAGVAGLLAGCGQQPQGGGMPGFPPAEVTTVAVQPASFPVAFEYVGQAAGSKDAEVRSRVTGIVEKRLYQEGARVRAGQPLFQIDPRPYQTQVAQADAEVARAQPASSGSEYSRPSGFRHSPSSESRGP